MQKLAREAAEAGKLVQEAREAMDRGAPSRCVSLLGRVLYEMGVAQEAADLRLLRAECALALRQFTTVNREIR